MMREGFFLICLAMDLLVQPWKWTSVLKLLSHHSDARHHGCNVEEPQEKLTL